MSTLSTSILELGFTSERDMEEALARQVMYGGDLGTNLLELGVLSEEQLLEAASRSAGLSPAPAGPLAIPSPAVAALVPAALQRRHGVHVLGTDSDAVLVAVSARLTPHTEEELTAATGRPLRQLLTTWARIEEALGRGRALPERAARLLDRLDGRASAAPLPPGVPVDFKQLPRPQSVPPIEFSAMTHDFDVATAPPPEGYVELAQSQGPAAPVAEPYERALLGPVLTPRRRGPYTAAMAERDLVEAQDRHQVLAAFFDFAAQYFEYAALFVLKGGEAVGYRSRGAGASTERLRAVRIPLDLPSAFSRAREDATWVLTRLRAGGLEGGLTRDLGRRAGRKVLVLPLVVRQRTVLFLYGDHGSADVDLTSVGDVLSFAPLASAGLERAILRKKGVGRLPELTSLRPRPHHPLPSRDRQARAFAQMVSMPPPPPQRTEVEDGLEGPLPVDGRDDHDGGDEARPAAHEPIRSESRSWARRRSSVPPYPNTASHTLPGVAAPANPPPDLQRDTQAAAEILTHPTLPLEADRADPGATVEAPPPPELAPDSAEPPEDGWDIDTTFEDHERGTTAGVGPRMPRASLRPTAPFGDLDIDPAASTIDCMALVERLCSGDEGVLDELIAAEDLAVAALVSRFPGPLPGRVPGEPLGKASRCGPVLKALVRLGHRSVPYLTVRTADEDAEVRQWATRLLGELPSRESAQAVARRMVDDDVEVRRAALAAARMVQGDAAAREGTRSQLEELASDGALPATVRRAAVEALTDLREPHAVPSMIQLLGDEDREVSGAARWSLMVLTRQDFGVDQDRWSRFWATNHQRHRIEWLIDSLTHESRDMRRAAGDELKSISKEYFGYYDDLPEAERARVQGLYREWWEQEGRQRFTAQGSPAQGSPAQGSPTHGSAQG